MASLITLLVHPTAADASQTSANMASDDSEITVDIIMNDPVIDRFRNMLLATNLLKFNYSQFYPGGITDRDRKMAQTLDCYQQATLNDFIRRRVEKMKESPELKKIKREKKELKKIKREKKELEKIKREKKELKKIKREKKELKTIKREKKELKKKKRAETTLVDGDETPLKKLKLVEVEDNHAIEESMNLEAVSSSDLQRQGVPHFEPVGNLMAEGLKACTRKAEKKNEHVDESKDM